jgi:hypothetical protein
VRLATRLGGGALSKVRTAQKPAAPGMRRKSMRRGETAKRRRSREFDLGMFRLVGPEAFKDLVAIRPSDCIVSTRLKMLVEISSPSFSPDGALFADFSGHAPNHGIWQTLILISSHKCQ